MKALAEWRVSVTISAMSAPPMKALSPLPRSTNTRRLSSTASRVSATRRSVIAVEPTMFSLPALVSSSVPTPDPSMRACACREW